MADTAALVVALSAQLTKFEKDMQRAGIMAEKAVGDIENKFSKMNPQIKTSFLGNLLSSLADQAIAGVGEGVKELVDRFYRFAEDRRICRLSCNGCMACKRRTESRRVGLPRSMSRFGRLRFQLDEMKRGGDNALRTIARRPTRSF